MNIRCKFRVERVEPSQAGGEVIHFRAAYDPDNADDQGYSKYTPSGTMQIHVTKDELQGHFLKDQAYYITISPEKEG